LLHDGDSKRSRNPGAIPRNYSNKSSSKSRARLGGGQTWIIYADLDELQQYPVPPRELVAAAERRGIDVIYGWLLDRVAADGSLPAIPSFDDPNSPNIWNTFQIGCRLTGALLRSATRKVMMARSDVAIGAGHHTAGDRLPFPIPIGRLDQYVVYHFKWHAETIARLEWGLAHANRNPMWQYESRRFMDWLKTNGGKINLREPNLAAELKNVRT
jgi:hypothetical protein